MPLYEFRCDLCGEFEAWRTLSELNELMHCPECAEVAARIFSPPNINLNVGSFAAKKGETKEPKLVKQEREPQKPKYQSPQSGRPWMVSHSPQRY